MKETIPCCKCGGEGHLVCRSNIFAGGYGDLYTVDCEDCNNSTNNEFEEQEQAIEEWNEMNKL